MSSWRLYGIIRDQENRLVWHERRLRRLVKLNLALGAFAVLGWLLFVLRCWLGELMRWPWR